MLRRLMSSLVLAVALIGAPSDAKADAGATVIVDGVTGLSLQRSGFSFVGGPFTVSLGPGQSREFSFDYFVEVHDSGLPAPFDPEFTQCIPLQLLSCGDPDRYHGFEVAQARVSFASRDARQSNPFIRVTSATPDIDFGLFTSSDSFAERLTRSGTARFTATNISDSFGATDQFFIFFAFARVIAAPVPEPSVAFQLALGIALLGGLRMTRVSRKSRL